MPDAHRALDALPGYRRRFRVTPGEGWVRAEQIERAFSSEGCGAILIKLDGPESALYDRFYRLQWQLGWAATVHGVRRIEDTGFSRGQAVVHLQVTEADLV